MKRLNGLRLQASYTVEAALLLPLFLFAILKGLLLGIECYEDVCSAACRQEILETIEPAEWIWNKELLKRGGDLIHEHTVSEKPEKQLYGGGRAGAASEFGWTAGRKNDAETADTGSASLGDNGA